MKVTASNSTRSGDNQLTADASELRIQPGRNFPDKIETDLGNGEPFIVIARDVRGKDLAMVHYRQQFGILRLTVYNT